MFAQLSDAHYLPPLKQQSNNKAIKEQAIYLSTPETSSFPVQVFVGTSTTPLTTLTVSKTSPQTYFLGDGDNNVTLVTDMNTGKVLQTAGIRLVANSGKKFYVSYRGYSGAQAVSLTSKGKQALGTDFRWGGLSNDTSQSTATTSLGFMATEDNTVINLTDYDPGCVFRYENNAAGITSNTLQITLQKHESFVVEAVANQVSANSNGWLGAKISSTKPIALSNGGLNVGISSSSNSRDAGIDQPVSVDKLGKEYIFIRGYGSNDKEHAVIIATEDDTKVYVNGNTTPITTLDDGEYYEIYGNNYSSSSVGGNLYVSTSKRVYAYQCVLGSNSFANISLNFIAPVNCLLPSVLDNIPDIRDIAGQNFTGGITLIASSNTPNANINITDNSGTVTLPSPSTVPGNSAWKTFFIANLNGDVSVNSSGPIAVGYIATNGSRGVAGYYSGFDTVPNVNLELTGGGCLPGSAISIVSGSFDAYQWYNDGSLISGATAATYTPLSTGNYFVSVTKGTCSYESAPIIAYYCNPDILVTKTANTSAVLEGDNFQYQIKIKNNSVVPITNLVASDIQPSEVSLISETHNKGGLVGSNWTIGTLASGETAIMNLNVLVNDLPFSYSNSSFTNTVSHTQDQTDANISTDDLSETITVSNNEITLTKTTLPATDGDYDTIGEEIQYQFTVTNVGTHTLTNVILTDANSDISSIAPASIPSLAPGASANFTATHTISALDLSSRKVENTATITAELPNGFVISDISDDPNNTTNSDINTDGEPDDITVTVLNLPYTVISNRRITYRVNRN